MFYSEIVCLLSKHVNREMMLARKALTICLPSMYDSFMTNDTPFSMNAAKGGKARASVLSPEERTLIAKTAARARWGEKVSDGDTPGKKSGQSTEGETSAIAHALPFSMFRGKLMIGDMELECHVLSDFRRVFSQREVVRILSGGRESGNLQGYIDTNPLLSNDFRAGASFQFKIPRNPTNATGYEATALIEICEKYLEAKDQGLLKKNQLGLAKQAEIVMRASAKVGIIALIDEATGYQEIRAKHALQLKLQAFITEDLQIWAQMFPDEFWFELARLEGIHYSPRSRPLRWGKYVMAFVYDSVDRDIGKKLRELNPNPHYKKNHHQWLKDFGRQKINDHLQRVIAVMKLCDDMEDFKRKFKKVFQKNLLQSEFNWGDVA